MINFLLLRWLLLFLFPTGIVVGLAIWFSTLTAFVRLFAPLSYLLVALVALILGMALVSSLVVVAKQLGWKPNRRPLHPKLPPRDAPLADVFFYVVRKSEYGLANLTPKSSIQIIQNELMDRIAEEKLVVWGRIGQLPIGQIRPADMPYCQLNARQMVITRGGEWGVTQFTDVQLNWRQVRRTWPRPSLFRRAVKWRTESGAPDKAATKRGK